MGYSSCKMFSLGQKLNMPKRCDKRLYDHIKVVVCKKHRCKEHLIFEKWRYCENGQNWPRCMGYSPFKMVSLGRKLKRLKSCEKGFYDDIKFVAWKNNSILTMAKIGDDVWAIVHAKWSVWVKNQKCEEGEKNDLRRHLSCSVQKNPSKKHLLLEKWQHFENGQNWPRCMGYSPWKTVNLS